MRRGAVPLLLVLLCLPGLSIIAEGPAAATPPVAADAPPAHVADPSTAPAVTPGVGHLPWNLTVAAPAPPLAGTSTSAVFAEPPPPLPDTIPVVLPLLTASKNTTYSENLSAPTGTWARVVLNYTGEAVNGVYDSSYRAYLDQSLVLFGTTPEYGTWTVLKDLTEYSVLFHGTFNLTFLLGAAVTNGYFLSSLTLSFYPVPNGTRAPVEPTAVVPLWYRLSFSSTSPTISVLLHVPHNVTNATLELYLYGFGPDEFWYSTTPGYRYLELFANSTPFASVLPFPYINTGGIDLFTWRPITGAFTLNDRPYDLNVTAALGMLEGTVNLTARLSGLSPGSTWIAGGSLLLYTDPNASSASLTSYAFSTPAPVIQTSGSSSYDETASIAYHYSSVLDLPGGPANVTLWTNESYSSAATFNQNWLGASWSNLTAVERMSAASTTSTAVGLFSQDQTYAFPLAMSLGQAFVETSSNNGSYPIYGNFTSYLDDLGQEWNETVTAGGPGPSAVRFAHVDDHVTGAVNLYAGEEELTGPNAGLLLAITFIQSQTTKFYAESSASVEGGASYDHLLIGSAYQPNGAYGVETVLANVVSSPLLASVSASVPSLDVGGTLTLTAAVAGGSAPYAVSWLGLPPGCASQAALTFSCTPSAAGTYTVSAVVSDHTGALAPVTSVPVLIDPLPTIALSSNRTAVDVGDSIALSAAVSGGTAPLACRWSVDSGPWTAPASCGDLFVLNATAVGALSVRAEVVDATGATALASPGAVFNVSALPLIALQAPSPTAATVYQPVVLSADVSGGAGPLEITWFLNGTALAGFAGPVVTFVPLAPGSYTFSAAVSDAAGASSVSGGAVVTVKAAPIATAPATQANPGGLDWSAFLAIGLGVGLVAGLMLLTLLGPRRRAPPPARASAGGTRPVAGRP